jgi:hypothetical protein
MNNLKNSMIPHNPPTLSKEEVEKFESEFIKTYKFCLLIT